MVAVGPLLRGGLEQLPQNQRREAQVAIQSLKTMITTLLRGTHESSRWSGVVLADAVLHQGGRPILSECGQWVRLMVASLSKPEPAAILSTTIAAVTRALCDTHQLPDLRRELTASVLTTFITTTMSLLITIRTEDGTEKLSSSGVAQTILHCYNLLLPRFSSAFKPHVVRLTKLLSDPLPASCDHLGKCLQIRLRFSRVRGGDQESWRTGLESAMEQLHALLSDLLSPLIETPFYGREGYWKASSESRGTDDQSTQSSLVRLICDRLSRLEAYFSVPTSESIPVDIGLLTSLIRRCFAAVLDQDTRKSQNHPIVAARVRPGADRGLIDGLRSHLPRLHIATIRLLRIILIRCGRHVSCTAPIMLRDVCNVLLAESWHINLRVTIYHLIPQLLRLQGVSRSRAESHALMHVLRIACDDCLAAGWSERRVQQGLLNGNSKESENPISVGRNQRVDKDSQNLLVHHQTPIQKAASQILAPAIEFIPNTVLAQALRTTIEKTAILTRNRDAMIAAALNPPRTNGAHQRATLIPHLAREYTNDVVIQSLLKPRMPCMNASQVNATSDEEDDMDDEPSGADETYPREEQSVRYSMNGSGADGHNLSVGPQSLVSGSLAEQPSRGAEEESSVHMTKNGISSSALTSSDASEQATEATKRTFGDAFPHQSTEEQSRQVSRVAVPDAVLSGSHGEANDSADAEETSPELVMKDKEYHQDAAGFATETSKRIPSVFSEDIQDDSESDIPPINPEQDTEEETEGSDEELERTDEG